LGGEPLRTSYETFQGLVEVLHFEGMSVWRQMPGEFTLLYEGVYGQTLKNSGIEEPSRNETQIEHIRSR
jgi:hypothetical protein